MSFDEFCQIHQVWDKSVFAFYLTAYGIDVGLERPEDEWLEFYYLYRES